MRLAAASLCLISTLAWPCAQKPDTRFSDAENPRIPIEESFGQKDWVTVFQWAEMAQDDARTSRLPTSEQHRIRELGARAAIRLGRYTTAIDALKQLLKNGNDATFEGRLLEARLAQAESLETLDEAAVQAVSRRLREGQADVDLRVALVPQLRRAKRTELVTTVCRDLERAERGNVDVTRACSAVAQPAKPPAPRQLGGCT